MKTGYGTCKKVVYVNNRSRCISALCLRNMYVYQEGVLIEI